MTKSAGITGFSAASNSNRSGRLDLVAAEQASTEPKNDVESCQPPRVDTAIESGSFSPRRAALTRPPPVGTALRVSSPTPPAMPCEAHPPQMMTARSLRLWADDRDISRAESSTRQKLVKAILKRASPSDLRNKRSQFEPTLPHAHTGASCSLQDVRLSDDVELAIRGDFKFSGSDLTALPAGLSVAGDLKLERCSGLTTLPPSLLVGASLGLTDCASLTSLPSDLRVVSDIICSGLKSLSSLPVRLNVGGDLWLLECTKLMSLPTELSVMGELRLQGCTSLTSLPTEMRVAGDLFLIGCDSLVSILPGLNVEGSLYIRNCTNLASLPSGLRIAGLYIRKNSGVTSLPSDLHVDGSLTLDDCSGLTSLPINLHLAGSLSIHGCNSLMWLPTGLSVEGLRIDRNTSLTSLPADMKVAGGIFLEECTSLTSLPQNIDIAASIALLRCTALSSLPPNLHVAGRLSLSYCTSLTQLPAELSVERELDLSGCSSLVSLPAGLSVAGTLTLTGCTSLTSLPDGLSVEGDLDLSRCTSLTSLPEGLSVAGNLCLSGCTSLVSLPARLSVGGHLRLEGCHRLVSLPRDLFVESSIDLTGCTNLTTLPDEMLVRSPRTNGEVFHINISGTGLSRQVRERLPALLNAAVRVTYSEELNDRPSSQFTTLAQALDTFAHLTHSPTLLTWPVEQQHVLCLYLGRLTATADYANVAVRPALMGRLQSMLDAACANSDFRVYALAVLDDAMQTCGDRIILGLNTVELELALMEAWSQSAPGRAQALRRLGLSLMKLNVVHSHAARSCQNMRFVDEVEVYLAYETRLRQRLDLPGKTVSMLYSSGVEPAAFERAALDAEMQSNEPARVAAFFASWTPWQQHLRQLQADGWSFNQVSQRLILPEATVGAPRICLISQDFERDIEHRVYLGDGPTARVYAYDALISWWVKTGGEPAPFGPFELGQLWREAH